MLLPRLGSLVGRVPTEVVGVDEEVWPAVLGTAHVLLDELWRDADEVLPLPVLDHVEGLQRANDVVLSDAGEGTGGARSGRVCL